MDLVDRLEKRFSGWAIPHLTLYLIGLQALGVILLMSGYARYEDLVLVGGLVQNGEWTRLLSFMMIPKTLSPLWLFFAFYIFYLMGNTLEQEWGHFRYNLFILSGYLLTVAAAFASPASIIFNYFYLGGVFLAFASFRPNYVFHLFLILPVKVKWLAWLTVASYVFVLLTGDAGSRFCVLAAFINHGLFFGPNILRDLRAKKRREDFMHEREIAASEPMHVCSQCGASDQSDHTLHFRYCSTCGACFCDAHMAEHRHD